MFIMFCLKAKAGKAWTSFIHVYIVHQNLYPHLKWGPVTSCPAAQPPCRQPHEVQHLVGQQAAQLEKVLILQVASQDQVLASLRGWPLGMIVALACIGYSDMIMRYNELTETTTEARGIFLCIGGIMVANATSKEHSNPTL